MSIINLFIFSISIPRFGKLTVASNKPIFYTPLLYVKSKQNHIAILDDFALVVGVGELGNIKRQAMAHEEVGLTAGQQHDGFPFAVAAGMIQMTVGVGDKDGLGG